jgi:hypothetical protein
MTINKSQGQTLEKNGVYLPEPIFGHGQFYVGGSRSGDPDNLTFYIEEQPNLQGTKMNEAGEIKTFTNNIVLKQLLI